jgi:hypothetical protein
VAHEANESKVASIKRRIVEALTLLPGLGDSRFGAENMLHSFIVSHQSGNFGGQATLVFAYDGDQLVVGIVASAVLEDYFGWDHDPGAEMRAVVVDRNRSSFEKIMSAKYSAGNIGSYQVDGRRYPKVSISEDDMRRSGLDFTDGILADNAARRA